MEAIRPSSSRHIAVIGAGPAGLVTFRELRRQKHTVVVFERSYSVGGMWVYSPETESDQLGTDPNRKIINSGLYESLRVNLPRECMGFSDYPFVGSETGGDERRFPGHREVLDYLKRFAKDIGVHECMRFGTEVVSVEKDCDRKWVVRSTCITAGETAEVFDAVVVCNGHCSQPLIARIPGIEDWPGKQMHSYNYRLPDNFTDQVIVLIGNSHSSWDISREISRVAKQVHVSSRSKNCLGYPRILDGYDNIWEHTMIKSAYKDGTIVFEDGKKVMADTIIHCTGYKYNFPFIKKEDIVTVDDNRVTPLYNHVFPPAMAPGLSFIGLPINTQISIFPLCELQSKWVAAILSERISLPQKEEMLEEVKSYIDKLDHFGVPKRHTHNLLYQKYDKEEHEYVDWLAMKSGSETVEEWRKNMFIEAKKNRAKRPESFRDVWDDESLVEQAKKDFKRLLCL